jgi:hypothetical protein
MFTSPTSVAAAVAPTGIAAVNVVAAISRASLYQTPGNRVLTDDVQRRLPVVHPMGRIHGFAPWVVTLTGFLGRVRWRLVRFFAS